MKTYNKLLTGLIGTSLVLGMVGCSDDDPAPVVITPDPIMAPLDPQTATITITDPHGAAPVVTVSTQAADIELAGVAVDAGANTLDLTLTATNNAARILTNLKAVIIDPDGPDPLTGITADAGADPTVANSSGMYNAQHYTYFGAAIGTGTSADSNEDGDVLQITGIDLAATEVTFDIMMPTDHPLIAMIDWNGDNGFWLSDSSGVGENTWVDTDMVAFAYDDGGVTRGVGSIDGTKLYMGSRNTGHIVITDLNTLADPAVDSVTGFLVSESVSINANVNSVFMSADFSTLYALVNEAQHRPAQWYPYTNQAWTRLVKVDIDSMEITGSVEMLRNTAEPRARYMSIAEDGVTAVVVNASTAGSQLDIVDLDSMEVTSTIQIPLENTYDQRLRSAAITADGSTVYAMYRDWLNSNSDLLKVDVNSGDMERISLNLNIENPYDLAFGPDGTLYIGSEEDLFNYDLETKLIKPFNTGSISKMTFDKAMETIHVSNRSGTALGYAFDLATGLQLDTDGDTTDGVVGEVTFPESSASGHVYIVTTY